MRSVPSRLAAVWLILATAGGFGPPASADDGHDHERARRAVESGDILPLESVLEAIRPALGGEIVGIELEREGRRWIYEFKVIDASGRLREIVADAKTARILASESE